MSDKKELDIGLFGITGSGKTVYLSMLVYDISSNRKEEFSIEFESTVAEQYLNECIEQITVQHEFPKITSFREDQVRFAVTRTQNSMRLCFKIIDLPGDIVYELFIPGADGVTFDDPFLRRNQRYRQYIEMIDEQIENCTGFLFLVDPALERAAVQDAMIGSIVRAISRRRASNGCENLNIPIAFCMTKWDEYEAANSDPEVYASKILRISMNRYARRLSNYNLFACSAVGGVKFTEDEKIRIPSDHVSPKNVFAPITWFFEIANESLTRDTVKAVVTVEEKSREKRMQKKKKQKKQKLVKEKEVEAKETEEVQKDEVKEIEEEVEEPSKISESNFESEARAIMTKLSVDDFIEWTQSKLQEKPDKEIVTILAQLLVENLKKSIDEGAYESVIRNLDTLDNALIFDYSITENVDIDGAYERALTIINKQHIPSHNLEYMVLELCSHIEEMEEPAFLLLDEKSIQQKQGLLATLFYTLYRQDPEAFIRHIEKAPKVISQLVGEIHAAKWFAATYILINKENETVGKKILETMFIEADRLAKIPHPEGFSAYLKILKNAEDKKSLSKLVKIIIDQLYKYNRGYEALEYLKKSEQLLDLIEDEPRYRMIRQSFEDVAKASPKDIDEFAKLMIYLEGWYGTLVHEIKGDAKIRYIVLDLGLHLVRSIKLLMEKMAGDVSDKDNEIENLYVKARFLLNGIVRVFRSHADKKMAERLRERFKDLPKDRKKNRVLWIQTGNSIVEEKK